MSKSLSAKIKYLRIGPLSGACPNNDAVRCLVHIDTLRSIMLLRRDGIFFGRNPGDVTGERDAIYRSDARPMGM